MLSLHPTTAILVAVTLTLPLLATPLPTTTTTPPANHTTPTHHPPAPAADLLPASILPHALAADTCPTPPTEFLPYAPPPGYAPAPGCPPASEGTQPSENDPPAGFYGGASSPGTASSAETSEAARSTAMDALGRVVLVGLGWRAVRWCGGVGAL